MALGWVIYLMMVLGGSSCLTSHEVYDGSQSLVHVARVSDGVHSEDHRQDEQTQTNHSKGRLTAAVV